MQVHWKTFFQEKIDLVVICVPSSYACYTFGMVSMIRELGQRMTDAFDDIYVQMDQFHWHSLQNDIQHILVTILFYWTAAN